jgi:methylphosphotriester-DNA--protein-cysteine methyltransferase
MVIMATQKKSPMARMKEEHKDKETLVDRILEVIERDETTDKDEFKAKLLGASNKKLLRLLETAREVKTKFGSREKLAQAIAQALGKAKDRDYIAKLAKLTSNRLMDLYRAVEKKTKKTKKAAA